MAAEDPDARTGLTGEQLTMLMTLRLHAADNRSARPILGDRYALDLLHRAGAPSDEDARLDGNLPAVCARARLVDEVAREFLAGHPDAVVLHLGCGLDSRVLRLDPGPGVDWYDVDQAPVIALRRRLYDDRPGRTTVAASVAEPDWWREVPGDRPRLVVAEGLLMYLTPDVVRSTLERALAGEGARTVVADTVAPWVIRIASRHPAMREAGTGFSSSTTDLDAALTGLGPLHHETASAVSEAARRTTGAMSGFLRVVDAVPAGRRSMVVHRLTRTGAGS